MPMKRAGALFALAAAGIAAGSFIPIAQRADPQVTAPEALEVRSGSLTLRAQLWRPAGDGSFPAVLFNHGSYGRDDLLPSSAAETLGSVFARHGYVFLWLYRQGIGMSNGQGTADGDQMARGLEAEDVEGRNRVQLQLLEHEELNEAAAALTLLRGRADVDARRLAIVGHSFGGSLSLLLAAGNSDICNGEPDATRNHHETLGWRVWL
jgi:dienelactone hydrolase